MLQNNPELKSKIDQLWNKFWSGGISNPLTAIEQITYLLFMKRIDEGDISENLQLSTTKTELLFVENFYRLLKKGGTACVIVPQGVLFGSGGAAGKNRPD